ncbi:MAG: DsbA family protein [Rhodospirillales bacterium]|nr:DsbA family protein [Rhodospirillales bacterium]
MTTKHSNKELILVVDPMCSWCWGFAPAVSSIRQKYVDQLGIVVVVGGLRAGNDKLMDDEAKGYIRHHWEEVNKATGQPFDFDFFNRNDFTYDTEPPCRALVTVRALKTDAVLNYLELLHKSFYANNQDITDTSVLASLAVSLGVDPRQFMEVFESEEARAATLDDFQVARNLGVTGFPTVVAVDKATDEGSENQYAYLNVGYRPFEVLEPLLEEWMAAE